MTKAGSFALALFLLLAAMVAAAWGVARLEPNRWGDGAELAFVQTADLCYWTPGRELSLPTAVELGEARDAALAARGDSANLCYVTSTPFGLPSAHDLDDARASLSRAMDNLCPWDPTQGFGPRPGRALRDAAVGHGPARAVSAIPESIADAGVPIGIAAAALVAAALLALRIVRRKSAAAVVATRARPWLTPKRIGVVGAGWLLTVGVLAAAYPTLSQYLPRAPAIAGADAPAPRAPRPNLAAPPEAAAPLVEAALPEQVQAASAPNDFTVPGGADGSDAGAGARGGASSGETPSVLPRFGNNFAGLPASPTLRTPTASATAQALAANSESVPTLPTTSLAAIARYLPPTASVAPVAADNTGAAPAGGSTPVVTSPAAAPVPAARPSAPLTPAASPVQTVATPAPASPPAPVQVAAASDDEARAAIATRPIVDPANPLPSSPDAVVPVTPPVQSASAGGGDTPSTPAPPAAGGGVPTQPVVALDGDDPAAVPEPAMIGLFGLGVAALAARRRRAAI